MAKPQQLTLALVSVVPPAASPAPGGPPPRPAAEAAAPPPPSPLRPKTKLLEEALVRRLGPIRLRVTDNRSTLLSTSTKRGVKTARVHQLFLNADERLFADIAAFLAAGDAGAGRRIDRFVEDHEHLLDHHVPELAEDAHVGEHHDLLALYVEINARYFAGRTRADIAWGAASRLERKTSITLGTYDDRASRIHVHPALDQVWVPRFCVARIVHHEMLHAKFPPRLGPDGRRIVHGPDFRREEAWFEGAKEADRWFDLNLDRLLSYRPPDRRGERPSGRNR